MSATVYDHIRRNNIKSFFLILLFPISLCAIFFGLVWLFFAGDPEALVYGMDFFKSWAPFVLGGALVWMMISYFFGDQMMLGFAHATPLSDKSTEHKKVFKAVQNVALAAGLPTPKVYVIKDESLNAFATGISPQKASIALTSGIIKALEPLELEGVIAHEMAHIGNRDVRLNVLIISGIGILGFLGNILIRVRSRDSKNNAAALIMIMGLSLLLFNWIVAPLIRLAISRTNEYNADATAALITRNPMALASALQKISKDARVEVLDGTDMAVACIFDPGEKALAFDGLTSTHPSIENRVKRLQEMAGKIS